MKLDLVAGYIQQARHVVCLVGNALQEECGVPRLRESSSAYAVEEKYGYSPEEILSSVFFVTRPEKFYEYYKDVVLGNVGEPSPSYYALAKLEQMGKLKNTVTRGIFALLTRAGCRNVIELHGDIYHNQCLHCKKEYDINYVRESRGMPVCERCGAIIRPQIRLYGDMVDNTIMTKSVDAVEQADLLLVVDQNLDSTGFEGPMNFFDGEKLILIKEEKHFADEQADVVLYGKAQDILPRIVELL